MACSIWASMPRVTPGEDAGGRRRGKTPGEDAGGRRGRAHRLRRKTTTARHQGSRRRTVARGHRDREGSGIRVRPEARIPPRTRSPLDPGDERPIVVHPRWHQDGPRLSVFTERAKRLLSWAKRPGQAIGAGRARARPRPVRTMSEAKPARKNASRRNPKAIPNPRSPRGRTPDRPRALRRREHRMGLSERHPSLSSPS